MGKAQARLYYDAARTLFFSNDVYTYLPNPAQRRDAAYIEIVICMDWWNYCSMNVSLVTFTLERFFISDYEYICCGNTFTAHLSE